MSLDPTTVGVAVSESEWRKLPVPYEILPATPRSQALYALSIGPTTLERFAKFGVGLTLVHEGLVETAKNADGVDWWRLKEELAEGPVEDLTP